jgi:hypothetical protein
VGDFEQEGDGRHAIDHLLNEDNIYDDPALKAKLAKGIP